MFAFAADYRVTILFVGECDTAVIDNLCCNACSSSHALYACPNGESGDPMMIKLD